MPPRDRDAAEAFLHTAIRPQGRPEKITSDQRGRHTAALRRYNKTHKTALVLRHCQYLKNLVEPDPRAVKRLTPPLLGCNSF
jgi:transposase-like protein